MVENSEFKMIITFDFRKYLGIKEEIDTTCRNLENEMLRKLFTINYFIWNNKINAMLSSKQSNLYKFTTSLL